MTVLTKGVERLRIDSLSVLISDLAPSVISGAIAEEPDEGAIAIVLEGEPGGFIGGPEPRTLDGVWVPGNPDELWEEFGSSVLDLAAAGYPGCIGCAGPATELPWDEEASRSRLRSVASRAHPLARALETTWTTHVYTGSIRAHQNEAS